MMRASLGDVAHSLHLAEVCADARSNPLWAPLETVLAAQPTSAHGELEPALRDDILLITILVASRASPAPTALPRASGHALLLRRTSRRSPPRLLARRQQEVPVTRTPYIRHVPDDVAGGLAEQLASTAPCR